MLRWLHAHADLRSALVLCFAIVAVFYERMRPSGSRRVLAVVLFVGALVLGLAIFGSRLQ
jgi:hypothetical protein